MTGRTREFVLGLIGGILGFFGALFALFAAAASQAIGQVLNNQEILPYALGWGAMFFSIIGIIGAVAVKNKPKLGGWLMITSAIGGLISISFAYALSFVLLLIAGLMGVCKRVQKKDEKIGGRRLTVWLKKFGIFIILIVLLLLLPYFFFRLDIPVNTVCPDFSTADFRLSNYKEIMPSAKESNLDQNPFFIIPEQKFDGWKFTKRQGHNVNGKTVWYTYCNKGSRPGQNINNYYCSDDSFGIIRKDIDPEGNFIKEEKHHITLVFSPDGEYLNTACDT